MEPDTLKKQTCYRESVYILFSPYLALSLPRSTVLADSYLTVSLHGLRGDGC